jgi:SAM-dependent methyltransferase
MTDPHYRRWNQDDIVELFANKTADDFFDSETRLLTPIAGNIERVIDIGCASGRFIELLARFGVQPHYTGLDLSPASIERARKLYPAHRFRHANALDFSPDEPADLINATGVMQHEPRFSALQERMIKWSSRYVLFDVKLADIDTHIADLDRAYIASEPPMYFVILSATQLLTELASRSDIVRAHVYGYVTPPNAKAVIRDTIGPIVSAGVLLEVGTPGPDGPEIAVDLPLSIPSENGRTKSE